MEAAEVATPRTYADRLDDDGPLAARHASDRVDTFGVPADGIVDHGPGPKAQLAPRLDARTSRRVGEAGARATGLASPCRLWHMPRVDGS